MIVSLQTRENYPDFSRYLVWACGAADNTPEIVSGLMRHGEMSRARVRAILTTQVPPVVGVGAVPNGDLGIYLRANSRVFIDDDIARRYENNPTERRDVRLQRLIMAVLMHEFVHWGDGRDGAWRGEAPAHAFDREVFNGRVRPYW